MSSTKPRGFNAYFSQMSWSSGSIPRIRGTLASTIDFEAEAEAEVLAVPFEGVGTAYRFDFACLEGGRVAMMQNPSLGGPESQSLPRSQSPSYPVLEFEIL
jgi:hypothetical protein